MKCKLKSGEKKMVIPHEAEENETCSYRLCATHRWTRITPPHPPFISISLSQSLRLPFPQSS